MNSSISNDSDDICIKKLFMRKVRAEKTKGKNMSEKACV